MGGQFALMSHTPSNIIQSNEYYPFGLQTANSWTRDGSANNYLANGGTELNTISQVYDLDFRNYDPVLGRLNQVDPMADKYASQTPYNYAFNSPNNYNDVNGADPRWGLYTRQEWDASGGYFGSRMGTDVAYAKSGGNSGILKTLRALFPDATFSSGGSNGFYIKTWGVDYSTEGLPFANTTVLGTILNRSIYVSGISLDHFGTMTNPLVEAMHQGARDFANNPFGGALLGFLSGAPLGGGGAILGRALGGARAVATHFTSLGAKQIAISSLTNLASQTIIKQDISKIDIFDTAVAGLSGSRFIISGILGASLDVSPLGVVETAFDKGLQRTSNDLAVGIVFGGANNSFSSFFPGSTAVNIKNDFLWQLTGESLNWVINEGK